MTFRDFYYTVEESIVVGQRVVHYFGVPGDVEVGGWQTFSTEEEIDRTVHLHKDQLLNIFNEFQFGDREKAEQAMRQRKWLR